MILLDWEIPNAPFVVTKQQQQQQQQKNKNKNKKNCTQVSLH